MNPRLALLQPYPFERLRALTADIVPSPAHRSIKLSIGEPQHATPGVLRDALVEHLDGLATYPATAGEPALRAAIAAWALRRHGVALDPAREVLPVNGSREALFALAQTVVDASRPDATVVCPNPFYQIYEGAALLAGARTWFVESDARRGGAHDWAGVPDTVWAATQLLYVCSPDNPTGRVTTQAEWSLLFDLSERHGFVVAADECYADIYADSPPLGALQAAQRAGRGGYERLVVFGSLSKRSNAPGLRSGFVAGDAAVLHAFLRYRTYHGSAMGGMVQRASAAAWLDEAHAEANRTAYRAKFDAVLPILSPVLPVERPQASFYLWPNITTVWPGGDDLSFARALLAQYNVAVLPGSLLARTVDGRNPGAGRIRLALVADLADCVEAARRIAALLSTAPTPAEPT